MTFQNTRTPIIFIKHNDNDDFIEMPLMWIQTSDTQKIIKDPSDHKAQCHKNVFLAYF